MAGLLGASSAVHAQSELAPLREMVQQGRMEAAYQWALEHRAEYEGRSGFDFYYGTAAIDTGHVAEGIFALERVLMRKPGLDRARLELARGYFLLGEDRRAREEFRTVLAHDPPQAVVATVERFLEAIRRRADRYETVLTAYAEMGAGYDTNVNSATDADSVAIFDGALQLELSDSSQEQADLFLRSAAGGTVRHPLSPDTGVYGGIDVRGRFHPDESDFDTGLLAGRAGWEWRGIDTRLRLTARAQRFFLDAGPYRDSYGLGGDLRYTLTDTTAGTGFARVNRIEYTGQSIRDSKMLTVGVGGSHLFLGAYQPAVSASLYAGRELADDNSDAAEAIAERTLYGLQAGLRFVLDPDWTLRVNGQARYSGYGEEHALFGETRKETYYQADVALDWRYDRHWSAGPRLRHSRNDANIALYEYQRTQLWVQVRYDYF
ncbi:surface lipoprotein assembly modifier [Thiohalorhabdus sp. Cl-TMA]|uniref:Surface lipoprotein assembly modifier n=1 Tax=Thiohalorhabdus methylotrophus TaxID=3242694 RepID=A0ABV4TVH8_9GAMM